MTDQPRQRGRVVLLDRDGVINTSVRDGYVTRPEDLRLVPGSGEALAELKRAGFTIAVVSNQQCVGKGIITANTLDAISERLRAMVAEHGGAIDAFFYCPHLATAGCACRKPLPGLIDEARRRFGFDPAGVFMAGDSYTDLQTAANAGCRSIFVRSGLDAVRQDNGEPFPVRPDYVVDDLRAAAPIIVRETAA
jgi:D-glycero-D-manno-heptose 1,7-bisphosphate phosphatase